MFPLQSEEGAVGAEDSLTSTEFDRFLAERAAAAENLPTISREEKALMGEVNQSGPNDNVDDEDDEALPSSAIASGASSSAKERRAAEKPKKPEESLIEF